MSIARVAKHAGVSHATVSNVINRRACVKEETAKLVWQAIDQVGYVPRPIEQRRGRRARNPGSSPSGVIAYILPTGHEPNDVVAHGLMRGICEAVESHDLNLVVGPVSQIADSSFADSVRKADGCITHGLDTSNPAIESVLRPKRVVWVGSTGPLEWGDRVCSDHAQISSTAARYLQDCGCETFVYVNLDSMHPAFSQRRYWFRQAVQRAGGALVVVEPETDRTVGRNQMLAEAARLAVQQLTKLNGPRVGLFAACDTFLVMVDREARRLGLSIDESWPMIACDYNVSALTGLLKAPATFDLQPVRMGKLAVERLVGSLRESEESGQTTVWVPSVLMQPDAVGTGKTAPGVATPPLAAS